MKGQKYIDKQLQFIDDSVNAFVDGLTMTERQVFSKVLELIKQLELTGGSIKNNAFNVILVSRIKNELERIVINHDYVLKVTDFVVAFDHVSNINNDYFGTIAVNFSPPAVLNEIKKLNIETTISDLTENGIGSAYTDGIRDLLTTNITTGAKYGDMVSSLRDYIIGKDGEDGTMTKYARQIATDSLNQYNGQYIKATTDDLGLEWYMYVGSNIKTSRPFCIALTDMKYVHKSEIPEVLQGHINGKTVSLAGLMPETTPQNFFALRGGYNCGHQLYPVLSGVVPQEVRDRIK